MIRKLRFIKKIGFVLLLMTSLSNAQNGLRFDGTSPQDIVTSSFYGVPGSGARTIEAWVKRGNTGTAQQLVAEIGNGATAGGRFTLKIMNNHAMLETGGGTGNNYAEGTTSLNATDWYHIAATVTPIDASNATVKVYVNGVLERTSNFVVNTVNTVGLQLGGRTANLAAGPLVGIIDEVRYWDIALTAAQINASMNYEYCAPNTNLKAYFKFNQGAAGAANTAETTLSDASGNNFNGTLQNFALTGTNSNWVVGKNVSAPTFDTTIQNSSGILTSNQAGAAYQWIDCGNGNTDIGGATSQSYTPSAGGSYAVRLTIAGCSTVSTCQTITLGDMDFESVANVKLYPNPTNDNASIEFDKMESLTLTLINPLGQVVKEKQFNNVSKIDLDMPAVKGVYFVKIDSTDGKSKTFKLIKQ